MNEHPEHETLLRHRFDLLDNNERETVRKHVEGCERCRALMKETADFQVEPAAGSETQTKRRIPLGRRLASEFRSPVTPVLIMISSVVCAGLTAEPLGGSALASLVAGAAVVIVWLHSVLGRLESRLRAVKTEGLGKALPAEPDEKARFVEGLRLSVTHAIRTTRTHVNVVLFTAMLLAAIGTVAFFVAGLFAPVPPVALPQKSFFVVLAAFAGGVFILGAIWSLVRLQRLRKTAAEVFTALLEQAARQPN